MKKAKKAFKDRTLFGRLNFLRLPAAALSTSQALNSQESQHRPTPSSSTQTESTKTCPSNKEYLAQLGSEAADISFDIEVQLRGCIAGESYTDSGKCVTCPSNYYSVEVFDEPGDCRECPTDKATCEIVNGTSTIGPKAGYWRSGPTSDNFIPCLYKPACLGT